MSEANHQQKRYSNNPTLRSERLKEIDSLYRNQIKQIYAQSKVKVQRQENQVKKSALHFEKVIQKPMKNNFISIQSPNTKSLSTLNAGESSSNSKIYNFHENDDKVRASTFLKGESTKTIEHLRKENESKELKIRELTNKCEVLLQKLKTNIEPAQYDREIEHLKEYSDNKMQRLENLFKIKSQQIFFKIKLQVINLLQEFGVMKEQLTEVNQIASQGPLFTFMTKKLKHKLKDFRNKEQQSSFQIQKDKIMSQKQEQRIHYLIQTNELLKLSESKLKGKIEDLKNQLNEFIQKLRQKQHESESLESQVFQVKKQNQELNSTNIKLNHAVRAAQSEKLDERRTWQANEKEMKNLLNNYFVEKKKLEADLQESEGQAEQLMIKQKFLEQQNERINRDLVRWKERYEWIEKENEHKIRDLQQELNKITNNFESYKVQHNQGRIMSYRNDIEEVLKKVEEYQRAYETVMLQLEEERRLFSRAEEQHSQKLQIIQRQWLQRVKRLQKIREEELFEFQNEHEMRQVELQEQYQKKEKLFIEEMQAHSRALLAQRDKKTTQQMVGLEAQNDVLRREIQNLKDFLRAKEDFINAIRHHSK